MIRAVVLPCARCEANARVAFEEAPDEPAIPHDFACPRCAAPLSTFLNAASPALDVSEFTAPESHTGLQLARVRTETVSGTVFYPVILHHHQGAVSHPLMWPAPLPEVLFVGASPAIRAYRLRSASEALVWYSESAQLLLELKERLAKDFNRALRDERESET